MIIKKARQEMRGRTKRNGAPPWGLTELAVAKGRALATRQRADPEIVVLALYLAHTEFGKTPGSKEQREHVKKSAAHAKAFLLEHRYPAEKIALVVNAILSHHGKAAMSSKEAEVVRNAECFKFLTVRGAMIFLHDLGHRGMEYEKSLAYLRKKISQKRELLTLPSCVKEADRNLKDIHKFLA